MKMDRRSFMKLAIAGGVASQGLHLTIVKDLFAQKKLTGAPIVIGNQCDLTGAISSWGYWLDKAGKSACDYLNAHNGIAGRPVQYVVEDTETNPPTAARKFRSLVQRSRADFVIGSVHTGCNNATTPIAKELKTVYIPQGMGAEMTGTEGNRYTFRVGSDTYAQAAAGAEWAMKNLGKTWTFFFADYGWGWSHYNEHKILLDKLGAEIMPPIAVPLDVKDMLPYLVKISDKTTQLYSIFFGAQSVAFYQQSMSLGLHKRMKRYSVVCTHEAIAPNDIGGASEDVYLLEFLPRALQYKDTEHHRKLRNLMKIDPLEGREIGGSPVIAGSHYWAVWESVFFIKNAIEKSGWKSKRDNLDFIQALEGMEVKESFEFPQGDKYMRREDHKAVIDHWMSHVENGQIHVKMKIPKEDIVKRFPARDNFTTEKL